MLYLPKLKPEMMKKLFALVAMAVMSISALAQSSYNYYKFEDSTWNIAGRMGITYNLVNNVPAGMSRSGLGLDFCIMEGQYLINRNSILSLGLLDLQIDFRYLQKGHIFDSTPAGAIVGTPDYRSKARVRDLAFSFPLGYTQRFNSRWAASLFVAPGVGLVRYFNDYVADDVHYQDNFFPISSRAGFRLDIRAVLWFEDMGLMLRYQPVGLNTLRAPGESGSGNTTTFSIGIAFCY